MRAFLFLSIALSICFQSCTIEKRHYRPGYHIEWKNRKNFSEQQHDSVYECRILPEKTVDAKRDVAIAPVFETDPVIIADKEETYNSIAPVHTSTKTTKPMVDSIPLPVPANTPLPVTEKKLHWTAITALFLQVLFAIVLIIELITEAYVLDLVTISITVVLFIISLVSLILLRKKHDLYKGRIIYWFGLFWVVFLMLGAFFLYLS